MEKLAGLLEKAVEELYGVEVVAKVSPNTKGGGDYATNVAMEVASKLRERSKNEGDESTLPLPPLKVAESIVAHLGEKVNSDYAFSVSAPGFINVSLTDGLLRRAVEGLAKGEKPAPYKGQVVVTEFSDPNPFKVLHIGHFYTSVVGDAISNLVEAGGGKVHRVNFGGDVGLHVAKTVWAILEDGGFLAAKDKSLADRTNWIAGCYVAGTAAYEEEGAAKAEIVALNKELYRISAEDDREGEVAEVYWTCRQWSYEYFDDFYARVGVRFEKYYPESVTAGLGLETVKAHPEVYVESDGATVFHGEPWGLHTRVFINAAGLPTYEAKDVGLIFKKWEDYKFDRSVVITGNDITEYMKVVLKSIEQYAPELPERTTHLTHGNVKLAGGVKMSSRKGNFVRAVDVLEMVGEAVKELGDEAPHEEIALGAIKYAFLKNRLGPDLIFDPKESVNLYGNSGPYLQYSLARAKSILRKLTSEGAGTDASSLVAEAALTPSERSLALKLMAYNEVLGEAMVELDPAGLCNYLYELAQAFSRFYEKNRVVGGENAAYRRSLVERYAETLADGFGVLGIPVLEKI
ncbi:arginine--tRNA ligase [Candidatus Saccharibacteria bacterium]|nr:arginine--tRNA ligase [Candidatus Saccharibacteria bacterium]